MKYLDFDSEIQTDTFPDGWANYTEAIGSLNYRGDGIQNQAVFFSSARDFSGTGRLNMGILGISIFENRGSFWVLKSFNPSVAVEGTFLRAHCPQSVVQIGTSNFAFILDGGNANVAGGYYSYRGKYIFGEYLGKPKLLLFVPDAACESLDELTHWQTKIEAIDKNTPFSDLLLVTEGFYHPDNTGEEVFWKDMVWWEPVQNFLKKTGRTDFKIIDRYRFEDGRYVLAGREIE